VCLLVVAFAVAGCAGLGAALRSSAALSAAGYQNVNVNLETGSGIPAGGAVTVSYSSGPASNDQADAQQAEKIVWDTFPGRFGALAIVQESGGCAGPFCSTQSNEVADATYAQLAARFGPRPDGLDKASGAGFIKVPGWVVVLGIVLAVAVVAAAVIVVTLILKRKRNRPPGPPPWQPGPPGFPGGWPGGSQYPVHNSPEGPR
jgi:hypothetical protein